MQISLCKITKNMRKKIKIISSINNIVIGSLISIILLLTRAVVYLLGVVTEMGHIIVVNNNNLDTLSEALRHLKETLRLLETEKLGEIQNTSIEHKALSTSNNLILNKKLIYATVVLAASGLFLVFWHYYGGGGSGGSGVNFIAAFLEMLDPKTVLGTPESMSHNLDVLTHRLQKFSTYFQTRFETVITK